MAANLKFFCMHLNKPSQPRLRVKILLNYQLKSEVSWANFIMEEFLIGSHLSIGSME